MNIKRESKEREIYYDTLTMNQSFRNVHEQLKKEGICNNKFMFAIYDKSLIGVDPYDPDLTLQQKKAILVECMRNIWYYFREVVKIPSPILEKENYPYFELNIGGAAKIFLSTLNINQVNTRSRDCLNIIENQTILSYYYLFGSSNTFMNILSKRLDDSKCILQRIKDIINALPEYLRIDNVKEKVYNQECINNTLAYNTISIKSTPYDKDSATSIGRSITAPIVYIAEGTYIDYLDVILKETREIFNASRLIALNKGNPSFMLLEMYYGDLKDKRVRFSKTILDGCAKWKDILFDMEKDDIQDYINYYSNNGLIHIEYKYNQLGKNEEWYKEMCALFNNNYSAIEHEINLRYTDEV